MVVWKDEDLDHNDGLVCRHGTVNTNGSGSFTWSEEFDDNTFISYSNQYSQNPSLDVYKSGTTPVYRLAWDDYDNVYSCDLKINSNNTVYDSNLVVCSDYAAFTSNYKPSITAVNGGARLTWIGCAQPSLFGFARHPPLREEIARRYQTNYGVELDPDTEAIVTIGAKDALAHLLFAVVGPGDAVVSPNPAYPIHQYGVIMAEGHACLLPMPSPAEFLNRLEDLYATSTRKPKLLLISFPHNPTTTCVELDFFREIVAWPAATARWWCTISPMRIWASMATSRPASCRWMARRKWPSRSSHVQEL